MKEWCEKESGSKNQLEINLENMTKLPSLGIVFSGKLLAGLGKVFFTKFRGIHVWRNN